MQIESNNLPPEFEHVLNGSLLFEIYLSASDLTYNCTKNYTVEKTKIFFSFPRPIARNCGKHIFSSRHSSTQYESFGGWGHRSPWLPHAQSHETVENTSFHQNNRRHNMYHLEDGGIDPPASRVQGERSTILANPPCSHARN